MGGGSVEIACAEGGINVHAYDISAPLVELHGTMLYQMQVKWPNI